MIEATYVILDYIKDEVNNIITPNVLDITPGRFSPESSPIVSAVYNVTLNVNFGQPYINTDSLSLTVYHTDYHELQRIVQFLLPRLNVERARDNSTLYSAGLDEGIKFHLIAAVNPRQDKNEFIEGTEVHWASIDILIQYVRLSGPDLEVNQPLFIEGT